MDDEHLRYLAESLNRLGGKWAAGSGLVRHGEIVVVPKIVDYDSTAKVHAHFGLRLLESQPSWDCCVGAGASERAAMENLVDLWVATTGQAIVELLTQAGNPASRLRPDDPGGFPGWHVVQAPPGARFTDDARVLESARSWVTSVQPLKAIQPAVNPLLNRGPHGIKLTVGNFDDYLADVEVDGEPCAPASRRLAAMPKCPLPAGVMVRLYNLLLYPSSAFARLGPLQTSLDIDHGNMIYERPYRT